MCICHFRLQQYFDYLKYISAGGCEQVISTTLHVYAGDNHGYSSTMTNVRFLVKCCSILCWFHIVHAMPNYFKRSSTICTLFFSCVECKQCLYGFCSESAPVGARLQVNKRISLSLVLQFLIVRHFSEEIRAKHTRLLLRNTTRKCFIHSDLLNPTSFHLATPISASYEAHPCTCM